MGAVRHYVRQTPLAHPALRPWYPKYYPLYFILVGGGEWGAKCQGSSFDHGLAGVVERTGSGRLQKPACNAGTGCERVTTNTRFVRLSGGKTNKKKLLSNTPFHGRPQTSKPNLEQEGVRGRMQNGLARVRARACESNAAVVLHTHSDERAQERERKTSD